MSNKNYPLLLVIILAIFAQTANAQSASNYQFTALTGTFVPLTSGDTLNSIQIDDRLSPTKPIGFNFYFAGNYYSHFKMSSNGWLTFDTTLTASYNSNTAANSLLLSPGLMPLWDDISGADASAKATYQVSGTAPNRKLIIELLNWRWNFSSTFPPTISMQIHMYELDGKIEYIYRRETGTGNFASSGATIGIIDAANTFQNLDSAIANPTLSTTVLTTDIRTRPETGQIYRWEAIMCSPTTVYPDTLTTTSIITNSCYGYFTELGFTSNTPFPNLGNLSYQWQKSTTATGPWVDLSAPTLDPKLSIQVIDAAFYRVEILCSGTPVGKIAIPIQLDFVQVTQPTSLNNFSRCGPGSQNLIATSPAGYKTVWYKDPNTLTPIGEGDTLNTNYVPNSTNFYAAAAQINASVDTIQIGTATTTSGTTAAGPFNDYYRSRSMQIMYTAAEMTALGASDGTITTLGFDLTSLPTNAHADYRISITQIPVSVSNLTWQPDASFTEVYYNASYQPTSLGWQMLPLNTPFRWDGYSNIVIKICWTGGTITSSTGTHRYTSLTGHMLQAFNNTDNFLGCSLTGTSTLSTRPNIKIGLKTGCESARIPVSATINPGAQIASSFKDTTCSNVTIPIELTSNTNAYNIYEWQSTQPFTLYEDANATLLYTSGINNPTNLFVKSNTTGVNTVSVFATDTVTGCTFADTFAIQITADKPVLNLGGDQVVCVDPGYQVTLDAGNVGSTYLWDNGTTMQTRSFDQSGTYGVKVTNVYGCWSEDSVTYEIKDNPISSLLKDTTVCEDTYVTLDPGNDGMQYFWNTGETQRVISVKNVGDYIVQITAQNGCVIKDTATIYNNGKLPEYDAVRARNVNARTFQFDVINPDYIINYEWDFGDGNTGTGANPTHTYAANGNYIVTLYTTSSCGTRADSTTVHIISGTGINDFNLDNSLIQMYPNPANQELNIATRDDAKIQELIIFSLNGSAVRQEKVQNATSIKVNTSSLNAGMYQVKVITDKGVSVQKLTVVR